MASDPRAALARREHHASQVSEGEADRHREARDELIRALRRDDPETWTYGALARAVGCSPELVAYVVKRGVSRPGRIDS